VELVLWTPMLFVVMFAAVQVGLYLFAQHVATSAAQEGAREARDNAYPDEQAGVDWAGQSTSYAAGWAQDLIGGLIATNGPALAPTALPGSGYIDFGTAQNPEAGVSLTFNVVSVIPYITFSVSASSEGPVECFYNDTGNCVGD
jgi:Flp pilus assembly protein TadG